MTDRGQRADDIWWPELGEDAPALLAEGAPFGRELLRAAAGLSALARGGAAGVTAPDRAVIFAAALWALSSNGQVVLAATPDERSREALRADLPELRVLLSKEPGAILAELTRHAPEAAEQGEARSLPASEGDDRVWMRLLTGGSTGRPKLFGKTVGNLLGEVALWRTRLAVTPDDVVLATVSPLHIYGLIHSVLLPLWGGCRVVRETPFLPGDVERLALRYGATILVSSPAHLRAIQRSQIRLPRLRWVLSSGSSLPQDTAAALGSLLDAPVVEIYGSTESGAVACRCRTLGERSFSALPQVRCLIEGGGLLVRSPFVSPDAPVDVEGFFAMPDRVSPEGSGGFEVLGRQDDVVKIAGKRVDLSALDQRVRALGGVEDLALLAVRSDGLREVDIGVLVVSARAPTEIRALVHEALGAIVRPRWVQPVQSIPRTQTGKLDTAAARALLRSIPGE